MLKRLSASFDPYILALLCTVALASVLPARGAATLFEQRPMRPSCCCSSCMAPNCRARRSCRGGHWRLHLATLGGDLVLFPAAGAGRVALPGLPVLIASGMLFLTLLPSTVQKLDRLYLHRGQCGGGGGVGVVLEPCGHSSRRCWPPADGRQGASMSLDSVEKIVAQLLLPFIAGHLLRPVVGGFCRAAQGLVGYVDRGSILLVVYTAFPPPWWAGCGTSCRCGNWG
jgi:sodium/bile acid cotransporter 7